MHEKFEAWIKAQPFYTKLIYIHGERLFIRDNGEYQIFCNGSCLSSLVGSRR